MKLFLSWSGEQSRMAAEAFQKWIQQVIQATEPWMSPDIEKGVRWDREIADRLEQSRVGIFFLTRDNLDAPWLLFEAGAISGHKNARPCTVLLGLKPIDIKAPLGSFWHTEAEKGDLRKLISDM